MVPTNGGCAKRDVMCADPSPLHTEDQCLLPPQHREPGAALPSGLGVFGGDVGVGRQRGWSQGDQPETYAMRKGTASNTEDALSMLCGLARPQWQHMVGE